MVATVEHVQMSSKPSMKSTSSAVSEESGVFSHDRGLSWFVAGLFLIADLAGGGLVALPTAMIRSGFYFGLGVSFFMTALVAYTAYVLGLSWNILLNTWPEYQKHCRNPYPEMGFRSLGPKMRTIVSSVMNVSQFGSACVYLLLSSKNIHDFVKAFFDTNLSFCIMVIIVAVVILPVTLLKSPNDFWWAVVVAMLTTSFAVVMILIGAGIDYPDCHKSHEMPAFRASNYLLALGTLIFAYGGHSAFPTVQHDMRMPKQFTRSVIFAFTVIFLMYTPVEVLGYLTYGDSLKSSIINSIQTVWIQQTINILITVHCILTLTIIMNPLNQDAEKLFSIPHHFCWQRVAVRAGIMLAVIFVSESIPEFGPLMEVFGGTTLALTSIIFPCIFYLFLNAASEKAKAENTVHPDEPCSVQDVVKYTPKVTLIICVSVIAFGFIGGGAATFAAVHELTSAHFIPPCYVMAFTGGVAPVSRFGQTNCCGIYQNITTHDGVRCAATDFSFFGERKL